MFGVLVAATMTQTRAWRARVHATALIEQIRARDDPRREQIARRLGRLGERDRVWGRGSAYPE